jgi:hypothetical protein
MMAMHDDPIDVVAPAVGWPHPDRLRSLARLAIRRARERLAAALLEGERAEGSRESNTSETIER